MKKKCLPRKVKGGLYEDIKKPKGRAIVNKMEKGGVKVDDIKKPKGRAIVNKMFGGGPFDEDVTVGSSATTDGGSTQDNSNGGGNSGEKGGGISASQVVASIKGLGAGAETMANLGGKKKKTGKDVVASTTGMMEAGAGIGSIAGPIGGAIGAGAGLLVGLGTGLIDKYITNKKIAKANAKAKAELIDSYSKSLVDAKLASSDSYSLNQSKLNGTSLADLISDQQLTDMAKAKTGMMAKGGVKIEDIKNPKGRAIVNGMKDGGSKNYKLKQDKEGNVLGPNGKPLASGAVQQPLVDPIDLIAGVSSLAKNAGKLAAKAGMKALNYSKNKIIAEIAAPFIAQYEIDGQNVPLTYKPNKKGGQVVGPGGPKEDKVAANIPDGSFVVPAENAHMAKAIRSLVLGDTPTKKASVKSGKTNVKLSDGEHVFTPKEVKLITAKGIDLNALAPNADAKLDNGLQKLAEGGKKISQSQIDKDASSLTEAQFKKKYNVGFKEYNANKQKVVDEINNGKKVYTKEELQNQKNNSLINYGIERLKKEGASEKEINSWKATAKKGMNKEDYGSFQYAFEHWKKSYRYHSTIKDVTSKIDKRWNEAYTQKYRTLEKIAKESGIKNPTSKDVLDIEKKFFSTHKPTFGKEQLYQNKENLTAEEQKISDKYFGEYKKNKENADIVYSKRDAIKKQINAFGDDNGQEASVKQLYESLFNEKTTKNEAPSSVDNGIRSILKKETPTTTIPTTKPGTAPVGNPNIPTVTLDANGNVVPSTNTAKTGTGTGKRLPKKGAPVAKRKTVEPIKPPATFVTDNAKIDKELAAMAPTASTASTTTTPPKTESKPGTFAKIADALGGPAGLASLGQVAIGLIHSEATERPLDHVSPELMLAYKDAIATKTELANEADYGLSDKVKISAKNEIEANRLQAMNDIVAITSGQGANASLRQLAQDKNKALIGLDIADADVKLKKKQLVLAAGDQVASLANSIDQRRRKIFEDDSVDYQQKSAANADLINAGLTNFVNNLAYQKGEKDRAAREEKYGYTMVAVPNAKVTQPDNKQE